MQNNTVLFLGFGYSAGYIAGILDQHGWDYLSLSSRGHRFNAMDLSSGIFDQVTHILVTAPPNKGQDPILELYRQFIISKAPNLKWLGYLSATSVYGDHEGAIVTEISKCHPKVDRGKNRLLAEKHWQELALVHHIPLHIFRLSGIYGKDRNLIDNVRAGSAVSIIKNSYFTNRIYIKDLARAVFTSMQRPTPHEIYNLSDNMPASTAAVNDYIAFLLDKPELKKVNYLDYQRHLTAARRSFYEESKIVSNTKFIDTYQFKFEYPTYREGISDILKSELTAIEGVRH